MMQASYRFWRSISIRSKLLIAFITMVLLPMVAVSTISTVMNYREGRKQVIARLESVAALKEVKIKTWLGNLRNDLKVALEWDEYTIEQSWNLLSDSADPQTVKHAHRVLRNRFRRTIELTERLDELFIMSRAGTVVLSTDSSKEGEFRGLQPYFRQGFLNSGVHVQTLSYSSTSEGVNTVIAVAPIKDQHGWVLGVLCGRASLSRLNEIMLVRTGFGETGETYLVGSNRVLLTELRLPGFLPGGVYIHTEGFKNALEKKENGFGFYINYGQVPVIGVQRWIPELQVVLIAEMGQDEAYEPIYDVLAFNVAIAFLAVLAAGVASLFVTRTLATPLVKLAGTAVRIAGGELELTANIDRRDEIGILAEAFNGMTAQLRELIDSLEQRVFERTAELELQTIEKEAAEAANAAKGEFLARMSHEIRTPLNAVTGLTNIVLKSDLTDDQRDYLNKVQIAGKNLLEVVNDVLDFSKIEAGRLELTSAPFNLDQVMEELADLFSNRVESDDLELILTVDHKVPRQLIGDVGRLIQILTNLVENAFKFTVAGEIVVKVERGDATGVPGGRSILKFQVCDTGIGIDSDTLPVLFEPFTQADSSLTREREGTGLGLTICRRLIELMGGRIWADSTLGQGSTISFTVVFQEQKDTKTHFSLPQELHGLKTLVVDDSVLARQMLVDLLDSFNLNVSAVDSGEKAIAVLEQHAAEPYRLVLLDWMSGMDCMKTARCIREKGAAVRMTSLTVQPEITAIEDGSIMKRYTEPLSVIIVTTAYGYKTLKRRIEVEGADRLLLKPVKPSQLFNTILELFNQKESMAEPLKTKRATPQAQLAGRQALLVEDSELNRDVALALLKEAGLAVETAENGREAVAKVAQAPVGYDVIFMDIQMPVMDGYEATRRIREWETNSQLPVSVPIVALTAHALKGEKDKCLNAGMDDYISKPVDEHDLHRVLLRWVSSQKKNVNTATRIRAYDSSDEQTILDVEGSLQRLGGRERLYAKALNRFVNECGEIDETIAQYLTADDREAALRAAHTVKGSASVIGAVGLSQAAAELESAIRDERPDVGDRSNVLKNELLSTLEAVDIFLKSGT